MPTRDLEAPMLTPLPRSEVIPVLVSQCFGMASDPVRSLETVIRLVRGADCFKINMHDPQKAVDAVKGLAKAQGT